MARLAMVDDLCDEDGIDAPFERRMARSSRRRKPAPAVAPIELDEALRAACPACLSFGREACRAHRPGAR